jgi:hypothetical protein
MSEFLAMLISASDFIAPEILGINLQRLTSPAVAIINPKLQTRRAPQPTTVYRSHSQSWI